MVVKKAQKHVWDYTTQKETNRIREEYPIHLFHNSEMEQMGYKLWKVWHAVGACLGACAPSSFAYVFYPEPRCNVRLCLWNDHGLVLTFTNLDPTLLCILKWDMYVDP